MSHFLGYRKFAITVLYLCLSLFALGMGWITGEAWLQYTSIIIGSFMGANALDRGNKNEVSNEETGEGSIQASVRRTGLPRSKNNKNRKLLDMEQGQR